MNIPRAIIQSTVSEILETMYFMSPAYSGEGLRDSDLLDVAVDFSGDRRGRFRMQVTRRLATGMTMEFLVCEQDGINPDQVEATVKELANVACGAAMSAWMPTANFDYELPCLLADLPEIQGHTFAVASGIAEIAFRVDLAG